MSAPVTVVPRAYDLVLWLIPRVNEFPRTQRFVLGERIETAALDLLDLLTEAQFTSDREGLLRRANATLARLRHLLRLANDLHLLGERRYEFVSERVEEVGRMIGGWTRHQRVRGANRSGSGAGDAAGGQVLPQAAAEPGDASAPAPGAAGREA